MASTAVNGIREFYNAAVKYQFLRNFNFRMVMCQTYALTMTSDEIVYCRAKTLPGRDITNHTQPFMGLNLNYGGSPSYPGSESYQLEIIMDASGSFRNKLEAASRTIFNDEYSTGDYRLPGPDNVVKLALVDSKKNIIGNGGTFTLVGAQFRNIGEIEFDYWGGTGDLVKSTCTLAFQWYKTDGTGSAVNVAR